MCLCMAQPINNRVSLSSSDRIRSYNSNVLTSRSNQPCFASIASTCASSIDLTPGSPLPPSESFCFFNDCRSHVAVRRCWTGRHMAFVLVHVESVAPLRKSHPNSICCRNHSLASKTQRFSSNCSATVTNSVISFHDTFHSHRSIIAASSTKSYLVSEFLVFAD